MPVIYAGGTFDLTHSGHMHFLWQCKKIAGFNGRVVVALNTDDFIQRFKGKKPLQSYRERMTNLLSCIFVDEVIPNSDGEDSKPAILKVKPDFVVVGSDWAKKDYFKQMNFTQEWLDSNDIVLIYVPYTQGISTTDLKRRICESV